MENSELIKEAIKHIDGNGNISQMTLENVAKNAGFSMDYFNRIFRNHTGFNVVEYVRFRGLAKAAKELRITDRSVLDIAMQFGYESHDGFTRAFKAQYGKTPSEYRKQMKDVPFIFADHELNVTAEGLFTNELPEFKALDPDEVVDWLLQTDAKKHGYDAITIKWNGSCVLTDCDLKKDRCWIGADMFSWAECSFMYLRVPNVSFLRKYAEKLLKIGRGVVTAVFEEETSEEAVKQALDGIEYRKITVHPEMMYFGEPLVPSKAAEDLVCRLLDTEDKETALKWMEEVYAGREVGWRLDIPLSMPIEKRPYDLPIGTFKDGKLIAVSRCGIQEARGFKLNNCIYTDILPEYKSDELYKDIYKMATNIMMELGAVPFDDVQHGEDSKKWGNFTPLALGYEQVNTVYSIDFTKD